MVGEVVRHQGVGQTGGEGDGADGVALLFRFRRPQQIQIEDKGLYTSI